MEGENQNQGPAGTGRDPIPPDEVQANTNDDTQDPDETLDPDRPEDITKIERMRKQLVVDKLVATLHENKALMAEKKALADDSQRQNANITKLNIKLKQISDQNAAILAELNKTTSQLEDEKADNKDLLSQLETAMDNVKSQKIMLLIDSMSLVLTPMLTDGKYNWTINTNLDKVEDILKLAQDQSKLNQIQEHDKVVMIAGLANICSGENGRQVATKLLDVAQRIVRHTGVEVALLAIPPANKYQAQVLLCNMRLSKASLVPGIQYIALEDLHEMERSKSLDDDTTLSVDGINTLIREMEKGIVINPTRRPVTPLAPPDNSASTSDKSKSSSKSKSKAAAKSDTDSCTESDSDVEEILEIRREQGGRLIGLGGERVKSLCIKHKASIFVVDDIDDDNKSVVKVKGPEKNVQNAMNHVKKILKIRDVQTGMSPKPKKHKK